MSLERDKLSCFGSFLDCGAKKALTGAAQRMKEEPFKNQFGLCDRLVLNVLNHVRFIADAKQTSHGI